MSYYVTLPSNGSDLESDHGKLHNTQADFEIDLKIPLVFPHKKYEMGLAEISYRKSWLVNIGKFVISETINNKQIFEKELYVVDGISMTKLVDLLNEHVNDYIKPKTALLLNTQLRPVNFNLDTSGKMEITVPLGLSLTIEGYFVSLIRHRASTPQFYGVTWMELEQDKIEYAKKNIKYHGSHKITIDGHEKLSTKCYIVNKNLKYIQNLYIYTNIIDNVHVGSEMLKLLRMVPVRAEFDEIVADIFDFPHYLSLDSDMIDRIRMFICDSEGNKIKFTDEHSSVVYKLHFKPKTYTNCK